MRCGQCGVIFDVLEPSQRSSIPAPAAKSEARSQESGVGGQRSEVRSQRSEVSSPSISPEPKATTRPAAIKARSSAASPAPHPPESSPDDSDDDEFAFSDGKDTRAYVKTGEEIRECPYCHATVNPDATVCGACGFMLTELKTETGKPLERRWETGWSFRSRLIGFLICQGLSVASVVGGLISGLSPFTLVFPYVMYTGMTAFLFGSYNWVELARNKKGKLRLTQTWRICFIKRSPTTIKMREYEELATGVEHDFDTTDWIMLLFLLLIGVLPGLWWWFYAGSKDTYFVSLCRDHGFPVVTLYRGWDQAKMEDMAETISKVAQLPLRR
jgi:hypothetical protein